MSYHLPSGYTGEAPKEQSSTIPQKPRINPDHDREVAQEKALESKMRTSILSAIKALELPEIDFLNGELTRLIGSSRLNGVLELEELDRVFRENSQDYPLITILSENGSLELSEVLSAVRRIFWNIPAPRIKG